VDLAVPSGAHRPRIDYPPTKVHVFQARTFDLGKASVPVRSGVGFVATGPERTVVDCFRARHQVGDDLAAGGLRRYLRKPGAKPAQVLELASALRVRAPVLQALRLLQE
jgi:hypothetical protein